MENKEKNWVCLKCGRVQGPNANCEQCQNEKLALVAGVEFMHGPNWREKFKLETCAFCKKEPPTEKFYVQLQKFAVCGKCNEKLIEAWEDEARAITRSGEHLEVLLGLLRPEDLTEEQ